MRGLTYKQEEVLDVIKKSVKENGYPPTVREICRELGLSSPATAQFHLNALARKGYISKGKGYRTIKILKEDR